MDLTTFQRRAVIFIFLVILAGALLLARKEPWRQEIEEKTQAVKKSPQPARIDINTADLPTLTQLPGIGPGLAKQIVDYRREHGPFRHLNELKNVPGIGEKRIEKIKGKITLTGKTENSGQLELNLNTASAEQLCAIPGIGPKTAQRIVTYRAKHGAFSSVSQITNVPRVGEKTYQNIRDYLYVQAPPKPKASAPNQKKFIQTRKPRQQINTKETCPHCGRQLYEKGKRKKVHIRCPHCLKLLNE